MASDATDVKFFTSADSDVKKLLHTYKKRPNILMINEIMRPTMKPY